ncbi:hypothetical protein PCC21_039730 [Pectobacterium carotovorum subsp. carotovorum PCC21]|nr:hypothetical protein PCC21_039730 [Pectobacterium carotovorum subsp. carotovorum PCC21]
MSNTINASTGHIAPVEQGYD